MRAARQAQTPEARLRAGQAAGLALEALPEVAAARVIAAFMPIAFEIDVGETLGRRIAAGATVVYPRVTAAGVPRMRFAALDPPGNLEQLVPGAFGILEPPVTCPEIPIEEIDVVVMPGLAFDTSGQRLGYGGGYYDEVAARLRAAGRGFLVGVGFDFQLCANVPAGEGDVTIDCVVTDARVVRCSIR